MGRQVSPGFLGLIPRKEGGAAEQAKKASLRWSTSPFMIEPRSSLEASMTEKRRLFPPGRKTVCSNGMGIIDHAGESPPGVVVMISSLLPLFVT